MKNIIKAQLYQLKRDKLLWILFFGMILLILRELAGYMVYSPEELSGSYFSANIVDMGMYSTSYIILAAAYITGRDYMDKTINQDVLCGHSRKAVFWGRALPALLITLITTVILLLIIPICSTMIYGWGENITIAEFLFRMMIYVFLVIRVGCEVIFLTCVLQDLYKVYIVSFFVYFVGMFLDEKNGYVFASDAGRSIFDFKSWIIYHIDGTGECLYEKTLSGDTVCIFIATSIGISIICMMMAVHFFKVQDMD